MKRLLIPFVVLSEILVLLMSSCTVHKGQVINLNYGQAVSMSNQAVGTSSVGYFLCFGGNKSSVLLKEAKDDLIKNRPLKSNEKYVNQNLNISTTYYLFYTRNKFIITADVIQNSEHSSSQVNPSLQEDYDKLFNKGDSLISKSQKFKGVFLSETKDSKLMVVNRKQERQLLLPNNVFRLNGSYKGFAVGEEIEFKGEFIGSGKIKGFGLNRVMVIDKDGSKYLVQYHEIIRANKR